MVGFYLDKKESTMSVSKVRGKKGKSRGSTGFKSSVTGRTYYGRGAKSRAIAADKAGAKRKKKK
jgi:hypothetical protein